MFAYTSLENVSTLPELRLHKGTYILAIYILESSINSNYLPLTVPDRHDFAGVLSEKRKLLL